LFGHRLRFAARDEVLEWTCARGCGAGGSKIYPDADSARRYAAAFNREDSADSAARGRGAPPGLLPLRFFLGLLRRPRNR
jgi:hypothetical protein